MGDVAHRDADGEWWDGARYELPRWWIRAWPDGKLVARHKDRLLRDVVVTSADDPMKVLATSCSILQRTLVWQELGLEPLR